MSFRFNGRSWLVGSVAMAMITAVGCGSGEAKLKFTKDVAGALPQYTGAPGSALTYTSSTEPAVESILGLTGAFMKMECHHSSVDNCPPGTATTDDNKYTLATLIGTVYHAEMSLGNIYQDGSDSHESCGSGDDGKALSGHTANYTPAGSDKFIIPMGDLLDCTASHNWDDEDAYSVYSQAKDGRTFASITTRYQAQTNGGSSDIFQVYGRLAGGEPAVIAMNAVLGMADAGMRTLLIVNPTTHRFLVKMRWGEGRFVALGTGGVDPSTGEWVTGNYALRRDDPDITPVPVTLCLENASTPVVAADQTVCDDGSLDAYLDSTAADGWDIVAAFLGLEAADETNLAGFAALLNDSNNIPESEVPASPTDGFPQSISK